jgi:hypothetical protein
VPLPDALVRLEMQGAVEDRKSVRGQFYWALVSTFEWPTITKPESASVAFKAGTMSAFVCRKGGTSVDFKFSQTAKGSIARNTSECGHGINRKREGRIQSAERAVPTHSNNSKVTNLLSA